MSYVEQIAVRRYDKAHSSTLAACTCGHEWDIDANDISQYGYSCPACGDAGCDFKFYEADTCPNCDKLGSWPTIDQYGSCSLLCSSQFAYALTLKAASNG